jgi:hypothetical protein
METLCDMSWSDFSPSSPSSPSGSPPWSPLEAAAAAAVPTAAVAVAAGGDSRRVLSAALGSMEIKMDEMWSHPPAPARPRSRRPRERREERRRAPAFALCCARKDGGRDSLAVLGACHLDSLHFGRGAGSSARPPSPPLAPGAKTRRSSQL